ncbi:hypothetical protein SD81_020110 [Tolypothrix campylonemoides VB511288]|nr:hypothetical protein SD81_020110 [Tolypothrix campylonemoides VB511288]
MELLKLCSLVKSVNSQILAGFNYLDNYIETNATFDKSLSEDERDNLTEEHRNLVKKAKRKKLREEQTKALVNIFKQVVRRQHLPQALKAFNCTKTVNTYFQTTP